MGELMNRDAVTVARRRFFKRLPRHRNRVAETSLECFDVGWVAEGILLHKIFG